MPRHEKTDLSIVAAFQARVNSLAGKTVVFDPTIVVPTT